MKYLYGPINSRRLGRSLGITLSAEKTCNFDCVYCQLGRAEHTVCERREYIDINEIVRELKDWLADNPEEAKKLDYITFSGKGEPTLNSCFGELIEKIKALTPVPVSVITNSSLLSCASVRRQLSKADLVVPSLDAVSEEVFQAVDRPASGIKLEEIINGLIAFRQEFKGKLWLEVMVVKGLNDDLEYAGKIKAVIDKINPDKIQLNHPVRPPAESFAVGPDRQRLEEICRIFGDKCEIA